MSSYSTQNQEIWKDVVGYESSYQVSNQGRVKSLSRIRMTRGPQLMPERICKLQSNPQGYLLVGLWKNSKVKRSWVHRLVLEAFIGPRLEGFITRHLDGNPANNNIKNLEWSSYSANINDRKIHGTEVWGEKNGQSRLTKNEVKKIRELYSTGNFSMAKLAKQFGVGTSTIHRVVNRIGWRWL